MSRAKLWCGCLVFLACMHVTVTSTSCAAGTFYDNSGDQAGCVACAAGKYSTEDLEQGAACWTCEAGKYSYEPPDTGRLAVTDYCNTYFSNVGIGFCKATACGYSPCPDDYRLNARFILGRSDASCKAACLYYSDCVGYAHDYVGSASGTTQAHLFMNGCWLYGPELHKDLDNVFPTWGDDLALYDNEGRADRWMRRPGTVNVIGGSDGDTRTTCWQKLPEPFGDLITSRTLCEELGQKTDNLWPNQPTFPGSHLSFLGEIDSDTLPYGCIRTVYRDTLTYPEHETILDQYAIVFNKGGALKEPCSSEIGSKDYAACLCSEPRGATECSLCAAGKFSETEGSSACTDCAGGKYANSPAPDTGNWISTGTCADNTITSADLCENIAHNMGKNIGPPVSYESGGTFPYGCIRGACTDGVCDVIFNPMKLRAAYSNQQLCGSDDRQCLCSVPKGSNGCVQCAAGKNTNGISGCTDCPAGKFSADSADSCEDCYAYTISEQSGATACTTCAEGKVSLSTLHGQSSCQLCASGKYYPKHAYRGLGPHPASLALVVTTLYRQATECLDCPPGANSDEGAAHCQHCNTGYISSQAVCVESNGYEPSTIGFYLNMCYEYDEQHEVNVCSPCAVGKYSAAVATACTDCGPGKFALTAAASHCQDCWAGYYGTGTAACQQCARGTFSEAGSTDCDDCAAGKYYNPYSGAAYIQDTGTCGQVDGTDTVTSASVCQEIAAAQEVPFVTVENQLGYPYGCILYLNNYYFNRQISSETKCSNFVKCVCLNNTFMTSSSVQRTSFCADCPEGKTSSTRSENITACQVCVAGEYLNDRSCETCPAHKPNSESGSDSESDCHPDCAPGFTGLWDNCQPCPENYFKNTIGSDVCKLCTDTGNNFVGNNFVPNSDRTTCVCAIGYGLSGVQCVACPSGKYKDWSSENNECTECEQGMIRYGSQLSIGSTCIPCVPGYIPQLNTWNHVDCLPCTAGKYSVANLSTTCHDCLAGTSSGSGASACTSCVAGTFSTEGSACYDCAGGTFADAGATACTQCLAMKYAQSGDVACTACAYGKVSSANADECSDCAAGKMLRTDSTTCSNCEPGTYQTTSYNETYATTNTSYHVCQQCEAGKSQAVSGETTCLACADGKFSNAAASVCADCAKGRIPNPSSSSCDICSVGKFALPGASLCAPCAANSVSTEGICVQCIAPNIPNFQKSLCVLCEQNYYYNLTSACQPCAEGFVSVPNGTACVACAAGKFRDASLQLCTDCDLGKISAAPGASTCTFCQGDTFAIQEGLSVCSSCAAGFWAAPPSHFVSIGSFPSQYDYPCGFITHTSNGSVGTFGNWHKNGFLEHAEANKSNAWCPIHVSVAPNYQVKASYTKNEFSAWTFLQYGIGVDMNFETLPDLVDASLMMNINPYADYPSFDFLTLLFQHYNPTSSDSSFAWRENEIAKKKGFEVSYEVIRHGATTDEWCVSCPKNTYSAIASATAICTPCANAYFSEPGAATCTQFCPDINQGISSDIVEKPNTTAVCMCNAGYEAIQPLQSTENNNVACQACAAGKVTEVLNSTCLDCPRDQVSTPNGTACASCEQWGGTPDLIKIVINNTCVCPAGTMINGSGCRTCSSGTYQPSPNQSACLSCATLKTDSYTRDFLDKHELNHNEMNSESSCLCQNGWETQDNECIMCAAGKFAQEQTTDSGTDNNYQQVCLDCPAGEYQDTAGSTACISCATGKYAAQEGTTNCTLCIEGKYQESSGQTLCSDCEAGRYMAQTGSTECDVCDKGKFQNQSGATLCEECTAGKSQYYTGQSDCHTCAAGRYTSVTAATICIQCSMGTYQAGEASSGGTVCTACAIGKYQSFGGASVCQDCALGKYSDVSGGSLCFDCNLLISNATVCMCPANTRPVDKKCEPCPYGQTAPQGGECACKTGFSSNPDGECIRDEHPRCNVNRRLPEFALRIASNKENDKILNSTRLSSRDAGGVCHMQRLSYTSKNYYTSSETSSETIYIKPEETNCSLQMCSKTDERLMCSILEENSADPGASKQGIVYTDSTPVNVGYNAWQDAVPTKLIRKRLCSSCDSQYMAGVHARFLHEEPLNATIPHMSVGKPMRLSHSRLLANDLHRARCGSNKTCAAVGDVLQVNSAAIADFLPALMSDLRISAPEPIKTDILWDRNWVWCEHTLSVTARTACRGSIPKNTWLNHSTRCQACADAMTAMRANATAPVHFCLLNAHTGDLCQKLTEWRARVRDILCEAGGQCPSTDFFYTPTTYNMRDREFVSNTVRNFYTGVAGNAKACTDNEPTVFAKQVNTDLLKQCAAISLEPWVVLVQNIRQTRRMFVVLVYNFWMMILEFVHLIAVSVSEKGLSFAGDTSNLVAIVANRLHRATQKFVNQIGYLFDTIQDSVQELLMSRGLGKHVLATITDACNTVALLWNNIWVKFLCPFWQMFYKFLALIINAFALILEIPGFPNRDELKKINAAFQDVVKIATAEHLCHTLHLTCRVSTTRNTTESYTSGSLPTPTRCWSTYITFYGDNQQLSCSAADTCRKSRTSSALVPCATCEQALPESDIHTFSCDALTKLCTCSVPKLTKTYCASNDECQRTDNEASCSLIGPDLTLSVSTMPCVTCQTQRVCLHANDMAGGVCACGGRSSNFQTCSQSDAAQRLALTPILNNLCLFNSYLATDYNAVASFALAVAVPCQSIDQTSTQCVYVDDRNEYMVYARHVLRRRLLTEAEGAENTLYETLDPVCRDALLSDVLKHTRLHCARTATWSSETCKLLELNASPCIFCSVTDFLAAIKSDPAVLMQLVTNPKHLFTVVSRHGPIMHGREMLDIMMSTANFLTDLLQQQNISDVLRIETKDGQLWVHADNKIVPRSVQTSLQHFVRAMRRHPDNDETTQENTTQNATTGPSRRLLLFQELVRSTEETVQQGWDRASRLHQSYMTSLIQVLTYDYAEIGADDTWWRQTNWPPYQYTDSGGETCDELKELLNITLRIANGTYMGWLTLSHNRQNISSVPAISLRNSWPGFHVAPELPPSDVLEFKTESSSDIVTNGTVWTVRAIMQLLGLNASLAYNVTYSISKEIQDSFSCPYEAVQTCSNWHVTLLNGSIIAFLWFCGWWILTSFLGLGLLTIISLPFYALVVLRLCYGYTWTCLPMLPVCGFQDFADSLRMLLPLRMSLPNALYDLSTATCQSEYARNYAKQNYEIISGCVRSCRDVEFGYTSWLQVCAWILAEIGPGAVSWATRNSKFLPWVHELAFNNDLQMRQKVVNDGGTDIVQAHRICVLFNVYHILPYFIIAFLLTAVISNILLSMLANVYPFLMSLGILVNATTVQGSSAAKQDNEYSDADSSDEEPLH